MATGNYVEVTRDRRNDAYRHSAVDVAGDLLFVFGSGGKPCQWLNGTGRRRVNSLGCLDFETEMIARIPSTS